MRRNHRLPQGTVHRLVRESTVLVDLPGFGGSGLGDTAWTGLGGNVPEHLDRLIVEGSMPPVVVTFPDGSTRLGGYQYINSVGAGRYADYLIAAQQEVGSASNRTIHPAVPDLAAGYLSTTEGSWPGTM